MQKYIVFIIFLGFMSSFSSMGARNRELEQSIKADLETYYLHESCCDEDSESSDQSYDEQEDQREQKHNSQPQVSWLEISPESDYFLIDRKKDAQEKFEISCKSKKNKDTHFIFTRKALEKELRELCYSKKSRRYKKLCSLNDNFERAMEKTKQSCIKSKHEANETSLPENELIVPPHNPNQYRIHITHRQLDSSEFSNRLQKSKKPCHPRVKRPKTKKTKTLQNNNSVGLTPHELAAWSLINNMLVR